MLRPLLKSSNSLTRGYSFVSVRRFADEPSQPKQDAPSPVDLSSDQQEIINKIKNGLWIRRTSPFWLIAQQWANGLGWLQRNVFSRNADETVKKIFDKSFEKTEFLEGAKLAHEGIIDMFNERDWEGLEPITSDPLLQKWKGIQNKFLAAGLNFKINIQNSQNIEFYGILPGPVRQNYLYRDWLVLGVEIRYQCGITISKQDTVVFSESENQWDILLFGKGPLPDKNKLPAEDLDLPWILLDAMFFPARLMAIPNTFPSIE